MVHGGGRPQIMHEHSGSTHSWMQNEWFVRQDDMMPSIPYLKKCKHCSHATEDASLCAEAKKKVNHLFVYSLDESLERSRKTIEKLIQELTELQQEDNSADLDKTIPLNQQESDEAREGCQQKVSELPRENEVCPVTPKRYQNCHLTNAATVPAMSWKRFSFKQRVAFVILLLCLLASSSTSNAVECLEQQYAPLTGRAVVRCDGLGDFPLIYWFDDIEDDATAFIQKENGEVTGSGYSTGDYNIDNEGSLVINNVTLGDDRTFRVRALDSDLIESSDDVTLIVYVEPAEPLPEIPECLGQSTCILKGESDRGISCIHGQSRPAMEVSWFLRDGREDRLLDATVNQMVSADAVTFTTSAQLEMPIDAKMNQLLVLVCKSVQAIPGMKGTERKILHDISVDDPFTNVENLERMYAFEREEDFKIKCQSEIDTANNVVLWMYKSLISENFENILYSAYGDVAITEKNAGFNITDDGALVIKEVDRQLEGYYACVSSFATTFVKNLEVIVLPKPPRIVVKGCEPFQPCHLSAQEAETITCTVNGVRPQLDLSIVTYSMNAAVTYSAVNSHKKDGLFYTTIEGQVDVSKITCEENHVTVICQARGTAAYGFMSDATIMISVDADDCAETSTDMVNPDDRSGLPLWVTVMIIFVVVVLALIPLLVCRTLNLKVARRQCSPHHEMNSQKKDVEVSKFSNRESGSYLLPITEGRKGESELEQHQPVAGQIDDRSGS